jgi:aminoglycoside N3'-acetyltransferase
MKDTDVPRVDKADIVAGLRSLGLPSAAGVIVHSSLKSFGHVEGGAQTVVEALIEVVTAAGTLLMPSFNHGAAFGKAGAGYYHPQETATTNGAIPDLFWRLPDVHRSLNPTHPFAAWGKHARRYTENHHRTLTMGPESPLGLLQADGGFGLLLGVGYRSNTFHHTVEMSRGVPCLGLPDGRRVEARTWGWRAGGCPFTDSARYADGMADLQQQTTIGASRVTLFRLQDCYRVIAAMLEHGCGDDPPCSRCEVRPREAAQTVATDWDVGTGALRADSPARNY